MTSPVLRDPLGLRHSRPSGFDFVRLKLICNYYSAELLKHALKHNSTHTLTPLKMTDAGVIISLKSLFPLKSLFYNNKLWNGSRIRETLFSAQEQTGEQNIHSPRKNKRVRRNTPPASVILSAEAAKLPQVETRGTRNE